MKYKLFLCLVALATATPTPRVDEDIYRLPEGVVEVESYDLELRLERTLFETNTFEGTVIINFKNLIATNEIKLHAQRITITDLTLKSVVGEVETDIALTSDSWESDPDTDILTVTAENEIPADTTLRLTIVYGAILRTNEMYGFYRSQYLNRQNQTEYLGTTQFQATHARKAFPCFDEPIYKAVFNIKIRHLATMNAISNTEGQTISDPNDSDFQVTTFAATPVMSTYLIAFVVSYFTCDQSPSESGDTPHYVCSREETQELRDVALDAGPKLIKFMEDYTNSKYLDTEIGKMHEVAIPDFSAGAMENWGLLTYRETALLWDPEQSSNSYLQSITNVISHEVAHMWFGNLVTCHWWADTFLNEGFARYFQYFATAGINPSWELDKQFVTAQVQPMLVIDAQPSAAALSAAASTQAQISSRFASVSYNKGGSIFRMLMHAIGPDNFKTGIQSYLQTYSFKTATPENLWTSLQANIPAGTLPTGTTISTVMDSWINTAGFPLLEVTANGANVTITQKRFLVSGTSDDQWYVPITYTHSSGDLNFEDTSTKVWLLPNESLTIPNILNDENDWIILNNQEIGYYRIHYDDNLLTRIENVLKTNLALIGDVNRAQLVDDIYNLAKVGTIPYSKVFDFFEYLKNDLSYYPLNAAITAFNNMLQRTSNTRLRTALSEYILSLLDAAYNNHAFDIRNDDDQIYTFNRVQIITLACRLGREDCVEKAVAEFEKYKETLIKPDKNLKGVIYCNGLRHSQDIQNDWEFLWNEYTSTKLATEQITILSALGCATDENILIEYIQKSINSTSGIRQQDAASVFSSVYSQNPEGIAIAFKFLKDNYLSVKNYYGSMNALNNMFSGLAGRFTTQTEINEFEEFISNAELTEDEKSVAENALTNAKANLQWTTEFESQLNFYFSLTETGTADSIRIGFTTILVAVLMVFYQVFN